MRKAGRLTKLPILGIRLVPIALYCQRQARDCATREPDGTGPDAGGSASFAERASRLRFSTLVATLVAAAANLMGQPAINPNGVVNATGYQMNLAPNAVFVIFGRGMGPQSLVAASAPDYPPSLAGTSVTFTPTVGGSAVTAGIIYTIAGQVAGLLPSSVTPGVYAVRVTYNGQMSAPENATVAARSFGIATANSAGFGTAQATIGNVNGGISLVRFTSGAVVFGGFNWTLTPAHPGDTLVLWGTGGGADPANDTGGTSGDQTAAGNFVVIVAGRPITPVYAGTSLGYPGLWQINFVLPLDIEPDCFATVQVSAGGELGNLATIPIAAPGETACSDPGVPRNVLAKLDAGGEMTLGALAIARLRHTTSNTTVQVGSGWFARTTAAKFVLPISGPRFGYCRVYDRTYPVNGLEPSYPSAFLDAGVGLPLAGPGLAQGVRLAQSPGVLGPTYVFLPPAPFQAGLYTLTGNGGSQVGSFSASTNFPADFAVTNWDSIAVIDRTRAVTFNWSGSGFQRVTILFATNVVIGTSVRVVSLNCENIPASLGTYSVPPAALAHLLPGNATLTVHGINQAEFTVPLVGGGQTDLGLFNANLGVEKQVPVQ
jgi:uncharacterized protein (TIGR03437 family)